MDSNKKIKVLSLFTGAGGLDIGFHKAGFEIKACVEIEETFCDTLVLNKKEYFDNCQIINKDLRNVDPSEILMGQCDFIIGGPPCQSFSAAGRRAGGITGMADLRGTLYEPYCELIKHFKPVGFLFENVRGILSSNKKNDWEAIKKAFSELGYRINYRILDAADYGVPQHRERVILVGHKNDTDFLFPRPTYGPDSIEQQPYVSVYQAIADLQDDDEPYHDYGGKYGDLLNEIPPGKNYLYFTKELGHPNPVFAWRSRFSDFLYKTHPDYPSKTIVAKLGRYSGPFHWKNRKFTFQEFKRLQSFPDDYQFAGKLNSALQQLGNSVAPKFAYQLAKAVAKQIFKMDIELLPSEYKLSFDKRKSTKAKKTRKVSKGHKQRTLEVSSSTTDYDKVYSNQKKTYFCEYTNWNSIQIFDSKREINKNSENCFKIIEKREGLNADLTITNIENNRLVNEKLLKLVLDFEHEIGNGFKKIECTLKSNSESHIVAAWDCVERYLCKNSSYLSLMDVFGHFTEPHPIFNLDFKIYKKNKGFLLSFASFFSDFNTISKNYPKEMMYSFNGSKKDFNFIEIIRYLRSLRFDVRVYETNRTIPIGFFRCCYPFPVSINKQISIPWKDSTTGNQ